MKTKEYIELSLTMSKGWATGLLRSMEDQPLVQPTSKGGNHPLWVLGHLVNAESFLLDECMLGKPNRFPEFKELFSPGSQPHTDATKYPGMVHLFECYDKTRADTLAHLAKLSEEDLDKQTHAPEDLAEFFGTNAKCFAALVVHTGFHSGQVADARRAAGHKPLMM